MTLADELLALFDLTTNASSPDTRAGPTAAALQTHFEPRAKAITMAGPKLDMPAWASGASGADDIYVELGGPAIGVRLWDDPRGWGTYAELAVNASLDEVAAATGPLAAVPRGPSGGPATSAAYVHRAGRQLRVFAKHRDGEVFSVLVHYP